MAEIRSASRSRGATSCGGRAPTATSGKLLHLRKGESLSLQYHRVKDETIMLQSGRLLFETRPDGRERASCARSR